MSMDAEGKNPSIPDTSVSSYNVVWNTPGESSADSMPLGNGDIGLNVWVEEGGDLLFYIGKGDAWSEVHRLLKLGRMRFQFDPPVLNAGGFTQTLDLETGTITVRGGGAEVLLWVDANHPIIQLEITAPVSVCVTVTHEPWRICEHRISGNEAHSAYGQHGNPAGPPAESADIVLPMDDGFPFMGWYHHNVHSIFQSNHELQGLGDWAATRTDPLLHRAFGCLVDGEGFTPAGETRLVSTQPGRRFTLRIAALTAQTPDPRSWVMQCRALLESVRAMSAEERFDAHRAWWKAFWSRSHVNITGGGEETRDLSAAWHLYRYLCACQGRGEYPIKFNGGIINVDIPRYFQDGADADADYRNWGGPYWHQNTRQLYWPLLASGDGDLMRPFFDLYRRNLPHALERTRRWYGHDGAVFPETFYIWGAHTDTNYGFDRTGKPLSFVENNYIKRHWQGSLETVVMGLDYYDYFGDEPFLRETLLPTAEAAVTFYDLHYPRVNGKLRLEPAQAMESYWDVVNPAPDIAGLECVLERLTSMPEGAVSPGFRERCRRLLGELPPLPLERIDGETVPAPAEEVRGDRRNLESVALWAVFPYRRISVTGGNLELGRAGFRRSIGPDPRPSVGYFCWTNNNVFGAYLGLADEARRYLADRVRYNRGNRLPSGRIADFRFPSMAGAGEHGTGDWIPDLDNLGVVQQTIQAMLLQCDGTEIHLLPAWPKEWNVEFRLHAPGGTVVECRAENGEIRHLRVTPETRLSAVVGEAVDKRGERPR